MSNFIVLFLAVFLSAALGFTGKYAIKNLINFYIEKNCTSQIMIDILLNETLYCKFPL
jgi:hypothetical protein